MMPKPADKNLAPSSGEPCRACGASADRIKFSRFGHAILECPRCESWFVTRSVRAAEYDESYFAGSVYDGYDGDPAVACNMESHLALVRVWLEPGASLLDAGAATGRFLEIAGKDYDAEGVEISPFASEHARRKGLRVKTGTVEVVETTRSYDAITAWDLLEHLEDPLSFMKGIHARLRPDGLFFAHTVNVDSTAVVLMGKRWHQLVPPFHLSYFSRRGMTMMMEQSGFHIESLRAVGGWRNPALLVPRHWTRLRRALGFAAYIPLGDMMVVVARRCSSSVGVI